MQQDGGNTGEVAKVHHVGCDTRLLSQVHSPTVVTGWATTKSLWTLQENSGITGSCKIQLLRRHIQVQRQFLFTCAGKCANVFWKINLLVPRKEASGTPSWDSGQNAHGPLIHDVAVWYLQVHHWRDFKRTSELCTFPVHFLLSCSTGHVTGTLLVWTDNLFLWPTIFVLFPILQSTISLYKPVTT